MKNLTRLILTYTLIFIVGFSSGYYSNQYPLHSAFIIVIGFPLIAYWSWYLIK